ncbi:uncharacterized protein LOC135834628 [Planococcus citri]|uniref:uncharacterized protein LOC135834628 n=1 Tax=Planococcus citri TaxID=170843 RepID=UPI0031F8EC99
MIVCYFTRHFLNRLKASKMPLIASPRHATIVLFANVFINLYVLKVYMTLEDHIDKSHRPEFTRGKFIRVLELILTTIGCIIIEQDYRSFVKNLMKQVILVLLITMLIVDSLFVIIFAVVLSSKGPSLDKDENELRLAGSFVFYFDYIYKIFTIFIVCSFTKDFASMINLLPDDNTSENNMLIENEESSPPPSYEECVQILSEPPPYSEISKAEVD